MPVDERRSLDPREGRAGDQKRNKTVRRRPEALRDHLQSGMIRAEAARHHPPDHFESFKNVVRAARPRPMGLIGGAVHAFEHESDPIGVGLLHTEVDVGAYHLLHRITPAPQRRQAAFRELAEGSGADLVEEVSSFVEVRVERRLRDPNRFGDLTGGDALNAAGGEQSLRLL